MNLKRQFDNMKDTLDLLKPYKRTLEQMEEVKNMPGFEKASARQRGYIHGLTKKLGIDEDDFETPTKEMTVIQASEMIEELKMMADGITVTEKIYHEKKNYYDLYDEDDLPF